MKAIRVILSIGLGCIILLQGGGHRAWAQDKPVVDQILDILRANKQISDKQYQELKDKAEQEEMKARANKERLQAAEEKAAAPAPTPSPDTMRAYFKNGFNLETADGNFKLQVGALTQLDWNVSDPGSQVKDVFKLTGTSTGVEFRRARLYIAGLVYGNIDYKFEYDFAEQTGGQPSFKDVYMGMSQIPVVQYLRIGHFKEPFSLEELTPDTYTTFQERATNNAFAQPGSNTGSSGTDRNTGFAAYQTYFQQRMTTAAGGFRATDNFGNGFGSDSPYDITARITGLPLYDVGKDLIHVGFSYSHKFRHYAQDSQETISFASKPEAHLFPVNLVNTGQIPTDGADLYNPELAFVTGPFEMQGEYTWAVVDKSDLSCTSTTCTKVGHSTPTFGGGYIEGSYFLTGESRASFYRTQFGHFERVTPLNNFNIDGSHWGAWQIAVRYSYLDLESDSIKPTAAKPNSPSYAPGALDDITAGVNWYLNPVTRVTVDYIWAHRESIGDSNIVEGRFQLAF